MTNFSYAQLLRDPRIKVVIFHNQTLLESDGQTLHCCHHHWITPATSKAMNKGFACLNLDRRFKAQITKGELFIYDALEKRLHPFGTDGHLILFLTNNNSYE